MTCFFIIIEVREDEKNKPKAPICVVPNTGSDAVLCSHNKQDLIYSRHHPHQVVIFIKLK